MLAASRGEEVDRPPVWLMRQAGRHLPEYLELRAQHEFWDLLRTPKLAREVSLQPLRRYPIDAAILFSDILVLLDAAGAAVTYGDRGPVIGRRFEGEADIERIRRTDIRRELGYVGEALELLAREVHPDRAVIGFCGAPLTLAAYLIEGGPRGDLRETKALAYHRPELIRTLLDAVADAAADLLELQIEAGADLIQVFDSWSWHLAPEDYVEIAVPALERLIGRLRPRGVPIVLYIRGAATHLEAAASIGPHVLSIDSTLTLAGARARLGHRHCLQGNLDPAELLGPPERIRRRVRALIQGAGPRGLIVNVGQGLFPAVPIGGVEAFVNAVIETRAEETHGAPSNLRTSRVNSPT